MNANEKPKTAAKEKGKPKLTPRQRHFCYEYVIDHKGARAAIAAGYSEKTAATQASMLLNKVAVKEFVAILEERTIGKIEVTAELVLRQLAMMATVDAHSFMVEEEDGTMRCAKPNELTQAQTAAIKEFHVKDGQIVKYKLYDKHHSLELLGKYLGMFIDKHQVEASTKTILEFCLAAKPEAKKEEKQSEDDS